MRRSSLWFLTLVLALSEVFCWSPQLFGQAAVSGTVSGTVKDSSGAVIPGADVTLTEIATGTAKTTKTDSSGNFSFPNLAAPGDFNVQVEAKGFQRSVTRNVHLDPAGHVHLSVTMQLGQVTQTVEVTASPIQVQTSTAHVSRIITSRQLEAIPVNGRNFTNMLALQPGVSTGFTFNSFQGTNIFATQDTHVNGLRGDANNVIIGGTASTRTRANGATVAMPSMSAISEVNVVTNGYMPEYSRAGGGQIIVSMKSGGTRYHGEAYEFLRNDAFDARDFFQSKVSTLRFNDFGFSVGGPLVPHGALSKKAFFFVTQEWFRLRNTSDVTANVPSLNDRNGNFSDFCAVNPKQCPVVPAYLNGVDGLTAGQPFPNDTIPRDLWSPNGSAFVLMQALPTMPGEGLNFARTFPGVQNQVETDIKGDYFSDSLKTHFALALRHFRKDQTSVNGCGGSCSLMEEGFKFPSRAASFDATTTFSPTLLNDFNVGVNEDINNPFPFPATAPGLNRGTLGINFPYIFGPQSKDIAEKIPTVITGGFNTISGLPYPSGSVGHVWTVEDTVTKIVGSHTFKMGGWFQTNGENDYDQVRVTPGGGVGNNLNGQFTFDASATNPRTTGSPLADEFLGNSDNYTEIGFRNYTPWQAKDFSAFWQDSWKARPNLTIQGGLRWSYYSPFHSRWCNFSMFSPAYYSDLPGVKQVVDPTTGFVIAGNPYNGIAAPCSSLPADAQGHFAVFGIPTNTQANFQQVNQMLRNYGIMRGLDPTMGIQKHFGQFEPRFGFAWDPFGHGTTAIRGSFGVFYNLITLSDVTLEGGNSPFQVTAEAFNASADNPGGALVPGESLPIPITGDDLTHPWPQILQWNLTAQHMVADTLFTVGYVATRGHHLTLNSDLNQPPVGTFTANPSINPNALRPFPGISRATVSLYNSNSWYDSLQVSVERRFHRGLHYGVAYTFSKCLDQGDSLYDVATDPLNLNLDKGNCGYSSPHNLIFNYVYELPFHPQAGNLASKLYGGWEVSGVTSIISGRPFSVGASGDVAGVGGAGPQFADITSGCNPNSGPHTLAKWFNTSCFSQPAKGTFGTSARNMVYGPHFANFDMALVKNGPIGGVLGETVSYEFRAEFFNIFNHASFSGVSSGVLNSNFGQVTSDSGPRQIQFALKLLF
ncbi:MAG TPA: carboxypeptidase-like regulatory domain-containing protein [Terriglobia bacterium]|nr:carboxypeptidase-like regulatory domain-containing protein [Terriglobia bacterium]